MTRFSVVRKVSDIILEQDVSWFDDALPVAQLPNKTKFRNGITRICRCFINGMNADKDAQLSRSDRGPEDPFMLVSYAVSLLEEMTKDICVEVSK